MADIYAAQLSPSKVEVVTEWVTDQDWAADYDLAAAPLEIGRASCRERV